MKPGIRIILLIFLLLVCVSGPQSGVNAEELNLVNLYFFNGDGCPHCADENVFLQEMSEAYGDQLVIHSFEVWYNADNAKKFEEFAAAFEFEPTGVPVTFIGNQHWTGFSSATRESIQAAIEDGIQNGVVDALQIVNGEEPAIPTIPGDSATLIDVPLLGKVDLAGKSIWLSTLLIGIVDGVNPCSLWVLTILLAMIVRTESRKKTLIIGFVFLTVTSLIYALFITGVFTILSYISFMKWIQIGVAVVTLVMGLINFKDYFFFKQGVSLTIDEKHKPGIYERIRDVMNKSDNLWAMIGATVILGVGVSLVEFSCTAAFPVVWSNLVVSAGVSTPTFIALLVFYMVLYQIDELVIFLIAVFTMRSNRMKEEQGQILKLFSGTLMVVLSIVMIVNPAWMNRLGNTLLTFAIAIAVTGCIYLTMGWLLPKFGVYIGHKKAPKKKGKKNR